MRSLQGRAAAHPFVEKNKPTMLAALFGLLAILVLSAVFVPGVLSPRSDVSPAAVATSPATSHPLLSIASTPASLTPHAGGLYIQGFNITPNAMGLGTWTTFSVALNGQTDFTLIPATLNITYATSSKLALCTSGGMAGSQWCNSLNVTSFPFVPTVIGTFTIWVFVNATCNPTPTTWAPCGGSASATLTIKDFPYGGAYLQGLNATPSVIMLGESLQINASWAGPTVIPATVNITYASMPGAGTCLDAVGGWGDWCTTIPGVVNGLNTTPVWLTPSAPGNYTVVAYVNATCSPSVGVFQPCAAVDTVSFAVWADPLVEVSTTAPAVMTGPFAASVSFTNVWYSAWVGQQVTEVIQVFSVNGAGTVFQYGLPSDPKFAVPSGPTPTTYSQSFNLADLSLPGDEGNLPAGDYYIGVAVMDANGTVLTSGVTDGSPFSVTYATVGPGALPLGGHATFVAGSTVSISYSTEGLTSDNVLNLSVTEMPTAGGTTIILLGNVFQAAGYSAGSIPLTLTVPGTYLVNLIGSPSIAFNVSSWFTVTPAVSTTCAPPSFPSGSVCLQVNNWANTTYDNATKVSGLGVNTIGAILIVIGILVGGIIGLMTGMMGKKTRMPPTDYTGAGTASTSPPPANKPGGGEFS